jgi:hypothetical protein
MVIASGLPLGREVPAPDAVERRDPGFAPRIERARRGRQRAFGEAPGAAHAAGDAAYRRIHQAGNPRRPAVGCSAQWRRQPRDVAMHFLDQRGDAGHRIEAQAPQGVQVGEREWRPGAVGALPRDRVPCHEYPPPAPPFACRFGHCATTGRPKAERLT